MTRARDRDASVDFGRWLRQERKSRGLTQIALARMAHISPSAVSHYEAGRTNPSDYSRGAIQRVLGEVPASESFESEALGEVLRRESYESEVVGEVSAPLSYESEVIGDDTRRRGRLRALARVEEFAGEILVVSSRDEERDAAELALIACRALTKFASEGLAEDRRGLVWRKVIDAAIDLLPPTRQGLRLLNELRKLASEYGWNI
jgi:transcriptional regulator with XRE-family HTH domain